MEQEIRYQKGLVQFAKETGTTEKLDHVLELIPRITQICGESTNQRRSLLRIGKTLLTSNGFKIIAPCCPDYSHRNGVYTFTKLNDGVSLLAQNQIDFLTKLSSLGISVEALFLYADQEADDDKLMQVTKINHTEFLKRIHCSTTATNEAVKVMGWSAKLMTEVVPSFRNKETVYINSISNNVSVARRLNSETMDRLEMYEKIQKRIRWPEALQRTIRTAAQYLVLGYFAKDNGYLISNHTTTNLAWYAETDVGVLHNPVKIY